MSEASELRLERLLGRRLIDAFGMPVGRIEDLEAEPQGDEYLVTHVIVGPDNRVARLLGFLHQLPTLRALGLGRKTRTRRIPWAWLDLRNPERPRLRGADAA